MTSLEVKTHKPQYYYTKKYLENNPEARKKQIQSITEYNKNRMKIDDEFAERVKSYKRKTYLKYKERYQNDEEFRKQEQQKALAKYYKRKARLQAEKGLATDSD